MAVPPLDGLGQHGLAQHGLAQHGLARPEGALLTPGPPPLPPLLVSGRRIRAQRLGRAFRLWVPAGVVILILAMCFLLPLVISLPSSTNGNILDAGEPPFSPGHWLGTDPVGVDIFSQIVYGGQVAFEVSLAVTTIGIVVGSLLGVTAAYFGGWVDAILSRVLDILIAFPALVLALAIAEGLGPSEIHIIWALSVFSIPAFGRIARGATLVLRDLPFMVAARLAGTRGWRAIVRHIVPNILPGIVTFSLLGVGVVIILEGALDYLGYGIPPPLASWGAMIANGQTVLTAQPEYVLIPSVFLVITVVALNMFGDALRERWGVQ
jgi:peptide/nickel transport system permease protein